MNLPVAALATAAGLALLAPAAATADSLSSGLAVTPPGATVDGFSIAASPGNGRVALVYGAAAGGGGAQRLLFGRLGSGRDLGPPRRLEERTHDGRAVTVFGQRVAVSSDGAVAAAWVARGREAVRDELRVAIAPRGRPYGPVRTVARSPVQRGHVPQIEVTGLVAAAHGRVVLGWTAGRPGATTMVTAVRAHGRFTAPRRLGPVGPAPSTPAALVLGPSGAVAAAWMVRGAGGTYVRAATLRPRARRFGAARRISGADDADDVGAFGGPGGAAVSWGARPTAASSQIAVRVARLRRDGTLAAPTTVATVDPGIQAHEIDGLALGFPLAGPVAAWQVFNDISEAGDGRKDQTTIDLTEPAAGGGFGLPQPRSAPNALTGLPVLGATLGVVVVAWPERIGTGPWQLRFAARPSGGDWRPTRTFADSDGAIAIATGANTAFVLWQPSQPRVEDRALQLAVYRP